MNEDSPRNSTLHDPPRPGRLWTSSLVFRTAQGGSILTTLRVRTLRLAHPAKAANDAQVHAPSTALQASKCKTCTEGRLHRTSPSTLWEARSAIFSWVTLSKSHSPLRVFLISLVPPQQQHFSGRLTGGNSPHPPTCFNCLADPEESSQVYQHECSVFWWGCFFTPGFAVKGETHFFSNISVYPSRVGKATNLMLHYTILHSRFH